MTNESNCQYYGKYNGAGAFQLMDFQSVHVDCVNDRFFKEILKNTRYAGPLPTGTVFDT